MKIGTDISIKECRDVGYLVMEFKVKELFPDGKNKPLDPDCLCHFTRSFPLYMRDPFAGKEGYYVVNVGLTANIVWESYQDAKQGIDKFTGESFSFPTTEYELLHLADSVDTYCGLE